MPIQFYFFILLLAFFVAKLEIQIEGKDGWAKKLPTWRKDFGNFTLTGYHFWLNIVFLSCFHLPFVVGLPWQFLTELQTIGGFILFWLLEDFMWFVFNPNYGLKNFNKISVSWHKNWFGPFPCIYYACFVVELFLICISLRLRN